MYVYKLINLSLEPPPNPNLPLRKPNFEEVANRYAKMGWRTVSAIPAPGPGYADTVLLERWQK